MTIRNKNKPIGHRKFKIGDEVRILDGLDKGKIGVITYVREYDKLNLLSDYSLPYDIEIVSGSPGKYTARVCLCAEYQLKYADNGINRAVRRLRDTRAKV